MRESTLKLKRNSYSLCQRERVLVWVKDGVKEKDLKIRLKKSS